MSSPKVEAVFVAPGNGGTAEIAHNLDIEPTDFPRLLAAVESNGIDLVVVGPEAPLAAGIVDEFQSRCIPVFGPSRAAAQLEASKSFARHLMEKYAIPCAQGRSFTSYPEAKAYLQKQSLPLVIKADGLAAGKGVSICTTMIEAESALSRIMESRVFGSAGASVVIEECLVGQEMSYLAFTDGNTILPMPPACDYKRVFDGNNGPNTGGMGAYCPPPFFTPHMAAQLNATVMYPIVRALADEGITYRGVIYAGLMLTDSGPRVLEFNARFGDPETQVIIPRLKTDLVDIMLHVIDGSLDKINIEWADTNCVAVVMASGGYPEEYKKGVTISGLADINPEATVFHAGTKISHNGRVVTTGGRVLSITGCGHSLDEARRKVYENINCISFNGAHYRRDIALFTEEQ
ncbi:phosphoribosylamine-glycine ligase [Dehalogenimonas sp. WBC-2]|nr:phosphoribosylamine-glycine ligase [Dehalogenimonas sp. WBC-2]